jgi:hypothetical protein
MKYVKMLGLAAVAAAALMAFVGAGTASATVLCKEAKTSGCTNDYASGTSIEATLEGSAELVAGGFIEDTCTGSTIKGKTSSTGGASSTVGGSASALTWSNCSLTTTTSKLGTLEIHHITGTDNGTLTASGFEVTIAQIFGNCVYKSGTGNDLGTLKGGAPATISISTTVTGGGAFGCPSTATWTAAYTVTSPNPLYISAS